MCILFKDLVMALPKLTAADDDLAAIASDRDAALQELKDHLLIAPAEVWLDVVRRSDAGHHYQLLSWMIEQPECDATIAQLVFYHCKPALMIERRITIDPAFPNHDALCRTVADNFARGQYPEHEIGVIPGELDARIAALRGVLDYVAPEDRVFDVPASFLDAPDAPFEPLAEVWTAEEDDHIRLIYQANGLEVITTEAPRTTTPEPGIVGNIFESIVSLVRRPKRMG